MDCATDEHRASASAVVDDLDGAVRRVWKRLGKTHGFLAWDDNTLSGLAVALRRYDLSEIVAVVEWSAAELAAGRLQPGLFATTFKGNAFCDRHRRWQAHMERLERDAMERKRMEHEHDRRNAGPVLSPEDWGRLGRQALLRFGGSP